MPTDEKILANAKNELAKLMEKARENGRSVDDNSLNHVSKSYGLTDEEMYSIMYKISQPLFPPDIDSLISWVNEKHSRK